MNPISIVSRSLEKPYRRLLEQHGSPLLVLDCAVLRQCYRELTSALPNVDLYYAIKSLPDTAAMSTLAREGAGFDVATNGELELLRSIGANPAATIHTHPIKRAGDITAALQFGCNTFVVDNIDELLKFRNHQSRVEILLRVSFRSKDASCDLSRKFGCALPDVPYLLTEAARLGIRVKGLSFHVGSQSASSDAHVEAIRACRAFYGQSTLAGVSHLAVLDIGGGFPVDYARKGFDLEQFCRPINQALMDYPEHVRIIAEPGRVLSAPAMISISTVMGRAQRDGHSWYYLDDGVYGAYSGQIYDHAHYPLTVFSDHAALQASVLAGPTCDSIDVISEHAMLPPMEIGDIVLGEKWAPIRWPLPVNSIQSPNRISSCSTTRSSGKGRYATCSGIEAPGKTALTVPGPAQDYLTETGRPFARPLHFRYCGQETRWSLTIPPACMNA